MSAIAITDNIIIFLTIERQESWQNTVVLQMKKLVLGTPTHASEVAAAKLFSTFLSSHLSISVTGVNS